MFKSTWKEDCMLWLFKTFIQTFHGFGIIFFNNLQSSQRLVRRPFQGLYQIVQVVYTGQCVVFVDATFEAPNKMLIFGNVSIKPW